MKQNITINQEEISLDNKTGLKAISKSEVNQTKQHGQFETTQTNEHGWRLGPKLEKI